MTDIVERLRACHGANSRDPGYCCQEAAEHIERLKTDAKRMRNDIELRGREIERLGREIERYAELLRGVGANRYWEGRWRDAEAEVERLRAALERANDPTQIKEDWHG